MTKLVKCTCTHQYQDSLYGPGNRMANEQRDGQLICTVCSKEHGSSSVTAAAKSKEPMKATESKEEKKSGPSKTPVTATPQNKADKKPDKKKKSLKGTKR